MLRVHGIFLILTVLLGATTSPVTAFSPRQPTIDTIRGLQQTATTAATARTTPGVLLFSSSSPPETASATGAEDGEEEAANKKVELPIDYDVPEDAILTLKPMAMNRLRELRDKQETKSLVLRMGVRSGGCSGMSYVMDFSTEDDITEDDEVDEYPGENIKCVVDAKSLLYLYNLELDYSDELIGGGFKFFNPNAEESCGCGSSFGV